jgi:hypothetical protein
MKLLCFLMLYALFDVNGKSFSIMHPEYNATTETEGLTLNGILFVSEKDWVIWVNHKRITPNKAPGWLKIIKVSENSVQCEFLYQNLWYQVTLEPYDTFTPTVKPKDLASPHTKLGQ